MLYIKELGGSAVSESEWHVGEPMPFIGASCRVISFQADGDELVLILDAMKAASKEPVRVITIEEAKQISDGFASEVAPAGPKRLSE